MIKTILHIGTTRAIQRKTHSKKKTTQRALAKIVQYECATSKLRIELIMAIFEPVKK